ncbi:MAG: hypothetical protein KAI76_05920 [Alphaproteobacteria bacterium]|nr:hypothetical protein [Alphaproteobacteria bacterium]
MKDIGNMGDGFNGVTDGAGGSVNKGLMGGPHRDDDVGFRLTREERARVARAQVKADAKIKATTLSPK